MTRNAGGDKTRKNILEFINRYWHEHGNSPSIRDITNAGVGVKSTSTVDFHLGVMEQSGDILPRDAGLSRFIVPVWVKDKLSGDHE